ncbi:MAG: tRNA (adenosine(37)-N6)-threonylcarbamoyltransferase complex transferase subunit TsaD [Deltaproteobacteria bacterium RIFCSPLOWO2_12_FULL_44_12]|nr:MAG: tRNA (adenosine(37)-N6)-threonylcarbamoyltransferase complex transferase subunit TsaD [Deltaproteobacteria bacterium RIFCSPHIGHO2_01_FULL_43_49]OGQ14560.1 MAG: tRNA (adenosine(37)-N6)-threonylcarbamoyltransferase complex transferase subunit TsaD [Deltaproteobacteria bacterium RIFCSPHIGHO2_02_FULL_44_53]OGQ27946.1 MAG: tRNA (adenosine(37)-N6)-threonylcarbamoyltransferase complex transferase subunit TsaD [Deltaproteobacteria bacterium RIFCSPHIGHO2_12_FULL_44_21]OGQ31158.1 MAG: tRNA (adenos
MKVLGIETSCDETAIAVVEGKKILSNVVASQAAAHAPYGGVVPEIASRHHVENLPVILEMALKEANISLEKIDAVAATHTPGLLGALLIGLQFGKSLAFALQKPFIGVNHLEGHLASVFLENEELEYPYLGLIVSGGHTHLYLVKEFGCYQLLGATRDDACGEAYDKIAKMLGLGFPGGPLLDKTATRGNPKAFRFTQPKVGECLDFSFSGFKTAALLFVQKQNGNTSQQFVQDLAASFQEAATNFLLDRLVKATKQYKLKKWAIVGGVAANSALRKKIAAVSSEYDCRTFIPSLPLCGDNGAMIAYVGSQYLKKGFASPFSLNAQATSELPS